MELMDKCDAFKSRCEQAEARVKKLEEALSNLTNEAAGFLSMADPSTHGNTNIYCLDLRIKEARAALGKEG